MIVRGKFPVELRVTDWVVGVLRATLPNEAVVELRVRTRVAASRLRAALLETPPSLPVRVTAWAV